tara:strand:+ start:1656 stop:2033 length:378 start_codon:yes stop_codon:yes gene_type:complete
MKIISRIRHSFKKQIFLKRRILKRNRINNEILLGNKITNSLDESNEIDNNNILDENNECLLSNEILNENLPINNNNLSIQNSTDIILPNENTDKSCSYVCLFIMIVFYYFSIIFNKIRHQLNKTN